MSVRVGLLIVAALLLTAAPGSFDHQGGGAVVIAAAVAQQEDPPPPPPPPKADLKLSQTDAPDPVVLGERITYSLTVVNGGPDTAVGVRVGDDLSSLTKLVSASASQGSCAGSDPVWCALGELASGATAKVTIVAEATKTGVAFNVAVVVAQTSDPDNRNGTRNRTTITSPPSPPPPPPAPTPPPAAPPPVPPPAPPPPAPPPPAPPPPAPPPPVVATGVASPPAASPAAPPASPPAGLAAAPDVVPPGNVTAVRAVLGHRSVVLRWQAPADPDFGRVVIRRSSAGTAARVVYSGLRQEFADRSVRNGVRYVYELRSFDLSGNGSAGVRLTATPKALPLFYPLPNARVSSAPVLRWIAGRGASYYNVQLYRGSRKVLSAWPQTNRLRLHARWMFAGRRERLAPGVYQWFVWPGRGPRSRSAYGPLLGRSSFVVVPPVNR
jgi:uncharacterized repeat protein (TIGR01451 family)